MTDIESYLEAERNLVRKYHKRVYKIKTWLDKKVRPLANESRSSPQRATIKDAARTKDAKAHDKWDQYSQRISDIAVREAMFQVDLSVTAVLNEVSNDNFTPHVDDLRDALESLREKANKNLGTRL